MGLSQSYFKLTSLFTEEYSLELGTQLFSLD